MVRRRRPAVEAQPESAEPAGAKAQAARRTPSPRKTAASRKTDGARKPEPPPVAH
jgi:hypothetical protein